MRSITFFVSTLCLVLFAFKGSAQTTSFNVPGTYTYTGAGVIGYNVDMAGGRGGNTPYPIRGGAGGRVQCVLNVTSGTMLNIIVGGAGANGIDSASVPGGYNNTGALGGWCNSTSAPFAYLHAFGGGGGGGASEICLGGTALANRVIVAGGGGGSGNNCTTDVGGVGGGLTGGNANECSSEYCGTGGSQVAPGVGGDFTASSIDFGISGNGASRTGGSASTYPTSTIGSAGGGGGGGYYGGGGGSWGGGGGGSSYTNPTMVVSPIHTQGYDTSDGYVHLTFICETPLAGTITGNAPILSGDVTLPLANPTGSSYGTWTSSNPSVASVNSTTGVVISGVAGTTTITFTATTACGTSVTTTATVLVNQAPSSTKALAGNNGEAVTVCPNPSTGTFTITVMSAADEKISFIVTNILGEKVAEVKGFTNKPQVLQLDVPAGTYFVKVNSQHGQWTEKVMILK